MNQRRHIGSVKMACSPTDAPQQYMLHTVEAFNNVYCSHHQAWSASSCTECCMLLAAFVTANGIPTSSPNFNWPHEDNVCQLACALQHSGCLADPQLLLLLLKTAKILSRKQQNRLSCGEQCMAAVVSIMQAANMPDAVLAEAANVLLNLCYERQNVLLLLGTAGPAALLALLGRESCAVQANAAGALQSICYHPLGRHRVIELGGVGGLLHLLGTADSKVVARVAGALHNVSSDPAAIRIIRALDGIQKLVQLLSSKDHSVSGAAAGAIQNLSREVASRLIIRACNAVASLTQLLCCADVHTQICAAGAILNILGPDMDQKDGGAVQRRALGRLMSMLMALAAVQHGCRHELSAAEAAGSPCNCV